MVTVWRQRRPQPGSVRIRSRRPPRFRQRLRPTCCEAAARCSKDGLAEAAASGCWRRRRRRQQRGSGSVEPARWVSALFRGQTSAPGPASAPRRWGTVRRQHAPLRRHEGGFLVLRFRTTLPSLSRPGQCCPQNPQHPLSSNFAP